MRRVIIPQKYEKYIVTRIEDMGGELVTLKFENGYGASVIHHDWSYGLELAVLGSEGRLCYSTGITDDVIGHLNQETLSNILNDIQNLKGEKK